MRGPERSKLCNDKTMFKPRTGYHGSIFTVFSFLFFGGWEWYLVNIICPVEEIDLRKLLLSFSVIVHQQKKVSCWRSFGFKVVTETTQNVTKLKSCLNFIHWLMA